MNALARRRRQTRSDVVRDALEQDEKARNVSEQIATKSYKLAEAALAILSLTLHDDGRVWKGLDWDLMDLLHEKGWIVDPQTKAKSVVLTEDGERLATEFLRKHFGRGAT